MNFRTRLDITNRQAKQYERTEINLSGSSVFGLPYSALTSGPNLITTGITFENSLLQSTFSGNTGSTVYTFGDSRMSIDAGDLSALTPTNSATTQYAGPTWAGYNMFTTVDGYTGWTSYSAVTYDLDVITMVDLGGGAYSGVVESDFIVYSSNTLDYTGSTIWVDVSGITRTEKLIISNNPVVGYVLTCTNTQGVTEWGPSSGGTLWTAGTGSNSVVLGGSDGIASGITSVSEGSFTTASGDYSHAEGESTTASGDRAHAEGYYTIAYGMNSHAQGNQTTASGVSSHSEGQFTIASGPGGSHSEGESTTASGYAAHAEGNSTIAYGNNSHAQGTVTQALGDHSHAGGQYSIASGSTSFVHGNLSRANGISTIVLGNNITGDTNNTTYVADLIIDGLTSTDPLATDLNGKIVAGVSDVRLKQDIVSITGALDKVNQLRGVSFTYTEESNMGGGIRYGFIAQEVQPIIPDMVRNRSKSDNMLNLNYSEVVPWLVEAVKELSNGNINTQTIASEDNNIELNYNGNHQSAIGGGITLLHGVSANTHSEFKTNENGEWVISPSLKPTSLTLPKYTPTSTGDIFGKIGDTVWDDNYLYVRTNAGWKRTSLENF